jgi:hypothetical protein
MATAPKLYPEVAHRFEMNVNAVDNSIDSRQQRRARARRESFEQVTKDFKFDFLASRSDRRALAFVQAKG